MARKLKVVHYFRSYGHNGGGVETHIQTLCASLKSKVSSSIICDRQARLPVFEKKPEADIYRVEPGRDAGRIITKTYDLLVNEYLREKSRAKILEKLDCDVLHVHGPLSYSGTVVSGPAFYPFYGMQAWKKAACPKVMTFHGLPESVLKEKYPSPLLFPFFDLWKGIERKNVADSKKVICVDKYVYETMTSRNLPKQKFEFIPNGIDTNAFRKMDKGKAGTKVESKFGIDIRKKKPDVIFSCVNRLGKDKGTDHILRIAPKLEGNFKFIFAGEGPFRKQVEALCKDDSRFVFLGNVSLDDVPAIISASDYAVNPAVHQGALRSNIEALSCHVPVIAYNIGDRYPVEENKTGYLCENIEEMTQAINAAAAGKLQTLQDFDKNCNRVATQFDISNISKRILGVYKDCA